MFNKIINSIGYEKSYKGIYFLTFGFIFIYLFLVISPLNNLVDVILGFFVFGIASRITGVLDYIENKAENKEENKVVNNE